eukprot:4524516-Prymnesium_polylepis.1
MRLRQDAHVPHRVGCSLCMCAYWILDGVKAEPEGAVVSRARARPITRISKAAFRIETITAGT